MDLIGIFKGSPTAGARDGVEVSTEGLMTAPVEAKLERGASEVVKCAIRCEGGCTCDSATLTAVDMSDESVAWLTLSKDNDTFSNSITLTNLDDTNTIFYARIQAGSYVGNETACIRVDAEVASGV